MGAVTDIVVVVLNQRATVMPTTMIVENLTCNSLADWKKSVILSAQHPANVQRVGNGYGMW